MYVFCIKYYIIHKLNNFSDDAMRCDEFRKERKGLSFNFFFVDKKVSRA